MGLLLPANKVWCKVIFSQVCFSHSVHREEGSLCDVTSCLAARPHVPPEGGLCLWSHVPSGKSLSGMFLSRVSLSMSRGSLSERTPWTEIPKQ